VKQVATQVTTRKILVIDDSRVIRNMVKDMLPAQNFVVFEAKDGVEGFEMAKKEVPWLIMLDFILPRMSGFQVYEALQQSPELSRIPLIIMSGKKEEVTDKIPEPFEEKYIVFISKPFDKTELFEAIKKAVTLAQKRPAIAIPATAEEYQYPEQEEKLVKRIAELEHKVSELEKKLALQQKHLQQLAHLLKAQLQH
jgi:DNA-binding response OmpR family regulator